MFDANIIFLIQYVTLKKLTPMLLTQSSCPPSCSPAPAARFALWLTQTAQRLPLPPIAWRIARFLTVGVVGLAVDSGVFWGLCSAGLSVETARVLSLALATFVTWGLNRLFTFAPSGRRPAEELARYVAVALFTQGFNFALFLALVRFDAGAHLQICLVVSAVATAALSFTGQNLIAFRSSQGR